MGEFFCVVGRNVVPLQIVRGKGFFFVKDSTPKEEGYGFLIC